MKKKSLRLNIILICIIQICIILSSCTPQKKPSEESQSQQEEKTPPKELDKLKESIQKIEKTLETIHESKIKPIIITEEMLKEAQKQESEKNTNTNTTKVLSPEEIKKRLQEEMKIKMDQENIKQFETLKADVMELHSTWNSYEPKAIADYAPQSSITSFENTLNLLTQSIASKDDYESLLNTVDFYKILSDFYMLYKTDTPPELDKFRYCAKRIMLLSEKKEYEKAQNVQKYLEATWIMTKPKMQKDLMDLMHNFEFAVFDLKKSIELGKDTIVKAKAEVLLKITDEIEKTSKEAKKKEQES